MNLNLDEIWTDWQRIQETRPLVHNITNSVVQEFTANALLAIGASPIMSDNTEEIDELISLADSLNINIGTAHSRTAEAMLIAVQAARRRAKPFVVDPVAVGATRIRKDLMKSLLEAAIPSVVRGNRSEIIALAGAKWSGKGVDAQDALESAEEAAQQLATSLGCVVVASGPIDLIADGQRMAKIANGHPLMARVTGSGCVATAITAAFLAVQKDPFLAALDSMLVFGIVGEMAAEHPGTEGPGSFRYRLLDTFDRLTRSDLEQRARVEPPVTRTDLSTEDL